MRVLIVSTNRCAKPVRVMPIGACRVAGAARRGGHQVSFVDFMFADRPVRVLRSRLEDFRPDVVGLSVRNVDNADLDDTVEHYRLPGVVETLEDYRVVIGGPAVSLFPGALLRFTGADWAVVGEGERAFPRLLSALEAGNSPADVAGVGYLGEHGLHVNPPAHDCSPGRPVLPDYDRWLDLDSYIRAGTTVPIQAKRGCPGQCVYCTYPSLEGRRERLVDPAALAEAVKWLGRRGICDVEFVDNVFNSPPGYAPEVCRQLARVDADVRLQTAELTPAGLDGGLLQLMQEAGFSGIGVSAESASDAVLEGLGKSYDAAQVRRAARALTASDLPTMWFYLLGGPEETQRTVQRTLDFAEQQLGERDAAVLFAGVRLYPDTPLEDIARREGQFLGSPEDMLEPVFYVSPALDDEWLLQTVEQRARRVPGFIGPSFRSSALAAAAPRLVEFFGFRPPAWQYTSRIRRLASRFLM